MGVSVIKQAAKKSSGKDPELLEAVAAIIGRVRDEGEKALLDLTEKFDRVSLETVSVDSDTVARAYRDIPEETLKHLRFAVSRIRAFAKKQLECIKPLHYKSGIPGVELGHRLIPVDRCGCYVPAGRHPLPSSALMSIAAAKVAGVGCVAACSPPSPAHGGIHPAVLAAMDIAGADAVYCMGGAQAVAAYAYGAGPVLKTDLIVGPGNRYVTEAKRQVSGDVGIDGLAGPSEVLIIADETANPRFIAIDLLSQAEHDPDAKPVLVSTSAAVIGQVQKEVEKLLAGLLTKETAALAWNNNGAVYFADTIGDAVSLANEIAPEHLELQVASEKERETVEKLKHYGSLFVGRYAPVAFGDFVSGTNHILPTMSTARYSSGVWAGTFIKTSFHQYVSREGCAALAESAMYFAEIEGLPAHRDSVRLRIEEG
ncbi:MAG: histidinol dehydrogenase [Treponema sp.]|jgi:histidinol dehydrogenase/sulfopropanediol 3-dehydrogenase|nr:histidinol dehydrogenase [Treponema sp.]